MAQALSKEEKRNVLIEWGYKRAPTIRLTGKLPKSIIDSKKGIKYIFAGAEDSISNATKDNERQLRYYDPLCKRNYIATYRAGKLGFIERLLAFF